jgi:hypothetical protein
MTLEIIRADKVDLPFIMTTERLEGYEALVGRWDQSRHRKALRNERYAYFLAKADGKSVGFAIVCDWASPERVTCVKRIAWHSPIWATDDSFCERLSTSSFGRQTLIGYGWACFPITIVPAEPTRELASSRRASPEGAPSLVANIEMS